MPIVYRPVSKKVLINEAIAENKRLDRELKQKKKEEQAKLEAVNHIHETSINMIKKRADARDRYAGFTEGLRNTLMEDAIYELYSSAMKKVEDRINKTFVNEGTMHALTYEFIHENGGAAPLIYQMRNRHASQFMLELSSVIGKTFSTMLEDVIPNDPETYHVDNDMMKKYNSAVKDCGVEEMSDCIADRVAKAIEDFIDQNARDKNQIIMVLDKTKEKVDSLHTDDESLKESYARIGRRAITEIRNRPKGLFTEMVSTMAEGVMKDKDLQREFMEAGHIDIDKIVNKITLMYGFMETVNTLQLVKIDNEYITNLLESMIDFDPHN